MMIIWWWWYGNDDMVMIIWWYGYKLHTFLFFIFYNGGLADNMLESGKLFNDVLDADCCVDLYLLTLI